MANHVYIHIPFCDNICFYCDFPKLVTLEKYLTRYLNALKKEITDEYRREKIKTLYIGGGTPTSLNEEQLAEFFRSLSVLNLDSNCEITIEANPENLTIEKLKVLKEFGVNRLSLGAQTFNEEILVSLNRKHTNQQLFQIIEHAKRIGIDNINVDLMFGFNKQSKSQLLSDLKIISNLDIQHVSIYSLSVEENSVFGKKKYQKLDEEVEYQFYLEIIEYLSSMGFVHYEISNFSKPGYQSSHNLVYWDNKEYYGFGLGAHSYLNKQRISNTHLIGQYCNQEFDKQYQPLTQENIIEEFIFLGLRKIEGISMREFEQRFNKSIFDYYQTVIEKLVKDGKLEIVDDYIRLTKQGLLLANDVMSDFIFD